MGAHVLIEEGGNELEHYQCLKLKKQKTVIEVRCLETEDTHLRGSGVVTFGGNEKEDWGFFSLYA